MTMIWERDWTRCPDCDAFSGHWPNCKELNMRFTDLSTAARSMLNALRSTNYLTTDRLATCPNPKMDTREAAAVLLELRKKGLVYSYQKVGTEDYCRWAISGWGKEVFDRRPDDVRPAVSPDVLTELRRADDVAPVKMSTRTLRDIDCTYEASNPPPVQPQVTHYIVCDSTGMPDKGFVVGVDRDTVVASVQKFLTANPGAPSRTVIEQKTRRVAVITAPEKPQAQIQLL